MSSPQLAIINRAISLFPNDRSELNMYMQGLPYEVILVQTADGQLKYEASPNLWIGEKSLWTVPPSPYTDATKLNLMVIRQRGDPRSISDIINVGEAREANIFEALNYINAALEAGYQQGPINEFGRPQSLWTEDQARTMIQQGQAVLIQR